MSVTQSVAAAVANEMTMSASDPVPPTPTPTPSPHPFLDLITSLFGKILPMLLTCIPAIPKQTQIINSPRLGHRLQLRALIAQNTPEGTPRAVLHQAMLNVGRTLTVAQVQSMQDEHKAQMESGGT